MLEKLNEEQEKQIEIIRNKWIDRALNSNGEYNEKNLKDGIDWLYSLVNLPPPKFKIIVNSPLAAQFAFNFITEIFKILKDKELKVNDQINDQVTSQVRNQIWDQVNNQIWNQVNDQIRNQVWDQVNNQIWNQVRDQINDQVWNQVRDQINNQIWNQVSDQVSDQVDNQVNNQIRDQINNKINNQINDQVWDQVNSQVNNQVNNQINDQVWNQVWDQVNSQVNNQIWNQVNDQIRNQVWDQVWNQIWNQVNDQINDQVTSQVRNQIWDQVRNQVGSQYINFLSRGLSWDSGWLAFFDYFGIIGIKLTDNFRKYESYIKQGFWDAILFENVVIIITPPIKVLQQNNRLHSNTEAAVQWLDGTENYFIEGVGFGKDIFEKIRDKKLTSDEAVNLRNVEQRTIAMRKIGYENVIRELGANILHTDGDYQLISVDMKDDDVPAKFVKVKCPSTGKEVLLRVDPKDTNIIDCMSAVSWTFVLNKEEYKPEIET
jgi:hypothetical protein